MGGAGTAININSGKVYIDVGVAVRPLTTKIFSSGATTVLAQRFQAVRASGNQFRLVNKNSSKCMDVNGGSTSDDCEHPAKYSCHGNTNQLFLSQLWVLRVRPPQVPACSRAGA